MKKLLKILGVAFLLFVATVSMAIIAELAKMFPIFGAISTAVWIFLTSWFLIEVRYGKDKAEAKWKEDFCEWEYNEFEEQWETSCGVLLNPNSKDREVTHYCCCCGKRIKIAEVE